MEILLFLKTVRDQLLTWNVFKSRSSDALEIRQQILSTRLYINQTEKKTVVLQNQAAYENLQQRYNISLQCFCKQDSIAYVLKARVQATLELLRYSAASNLLQSTTFVYQIARTNQLISGLLTNYLVILERYTSSVQQPNNLRATNIYTNIYMLQNSTIACSCKTNDSCPLPANIYWSNAVKRLQIYDLNKIKADESLPGLVVDCLPIQATFSSSLECFYSRSCLDVLLSAYPRKIYVSILNQSLPTRFLPSTKIEQLQLQVEQHPNNGISD
ncbi:hypothetical protein I4U23_013316 [Adineta vaga]|nr:hypothetical protein I4U23_013316 [Adineta vaga]